MHGIRTNRRRLQLHIFYRYQLDLANSDLNYLVRFRIVYSVPAPKIEEIYRLHNIIYKDYYFFDQ